MEYSYHAVIAFMPGSDPLTVARVTEFRVYDKTGATELSVTVQSVAGPLTATVLRTDSLGMFPDHTVEDHIEVQYVSLDGDFRFNRVTNTPIPGPPVDDARMEGTELILSVNGVDLPGVEIPVGTGGGTGGTADSVTVAGLPNGTTLTVLKTGATWPARPTDRANIIVQWKGPDPSPPIVSSGTGGMRNGVDIRLWHP